MSAPVLDLTADGSMVMFWCPGCLMSHGVWVRGRSANPQTGAAWDWNGDLVKPTVSPSILVRGTISPTDHDVARMLAGEQIEPVSFVCHSFVREGRIEFFADCTHALAGQTVDLTPT